MKATIVHVKLLLHDKTLEEGVKLGWQLKVFVLHGEADAQNISESVITLQLVIETGILELLREK